MIEVGASEPDHNLRRLLLMRVGIATALLLPVIYVQLLIGSSYSPAPLYALIGAAYGLSLAYTGLQRWSSRWSGFVAFQLTTDTILATLLVYAYGGVRSPLVLLYLIIAFGAGLMTGRQTALAIACLAGVAYGLMAHLEAAGWLPDWGEALGSAGAPVPAPEMYLRIFTVLLSSCLVAAISSSFSRRLERTRGELRQERSALEALQALNDQLLAGMSSGLVAADAHGRIIACNRAAERITGRPEERIVGADVGEILGIDGDDLADLDRRLEHRQIYRTERQVQLPSGGSRTVGMSVTKVVAHEGAAPAGTPAGEARPDYSPGGPWIVRAEGPIAGGYIFMFQDLTDVKRMERLFWMRERMALLGEMASSLAHEIRNPLASISGSLQMLRRGSVKLESERGSRLMGIVTGESERLSKIIEDFLDYARPEKLEAREADLVRIARETLDLLENSPELCPAHVLRVEAPRGPVRALVDPARVKQVLWNLARNGVQAMPGGGELVIRLRGLEGGAEVIVEDQGAGMAPEHVDRVFRPFVSGKVRGTGLGLAVVYRIMQQHGARIEVESELGRGTRFVLRFVDARVPEGTEPVVVVEGGVSEEARLFDELSRTVRSD